MYVRRVQGITLQFGHRGWLLDRSFIFYDREFDSLWVQATGRCIEGRFRGETLTSLPATHTTWGQWKALHPDTTVLAKPSYLVDRYRQDAYADSYQKWGVSFGLAVFGEGGQKLYPFDHLEHQPVLHDTVAGEPILVVFHVPTRTAVAFEPRIDGHFLDFELLESNEADVLLRDENGDPWSGLRGRPVADPNGQRQLRQLRSTQFVVSNWSNHFPGAPVFGTP